MAADLMCAEVSLCATPKAAGGVAVASVHSIDQDLRPAHASRSLRHGIIGKWINEDDNLMMGRSSYFAEAEDGPSFLFEPCVEYDEGWHTFAHEIDICLSGPEEACSSGPPSLGSLAVMAPLEESFEPQSTLDAEVLSPSHCEHGVVHAPGAMPI